MLKLYEKLADSLFRKQGEYRSENHWVIGNILTSDYSGLGTDGPVLFGISDRPAKLLLSLT